MTQMKQKKHKKIEIPTHKIRFKKEPIWLKCNFVGKYNGIKFRFMYHEYTSEEVEGVINKFNFIWPGRIPANKELAEEGIKTLFSKLKNDSNSSITMKVSKDEIIFTGEEEDKDLLKEVEDIKELSKEILEEIDETI